MKTTDIKTVHSDTFIHRFTKVTLNDHIEIWKRLDGQEQMNVWQIMTKLKNIAHMNICMVWHEEWCM